MTEEEKDEFIAKVKGKKIRYSTWLNTSNPDYFIPSSIDGSEVLGLSYYPDGTIGDNAWRINSGLGKCGWSFYEGPEIDKIPSVDETGRLSVDVIHDQGPELKLAKALIEGLLVSPSDKIIQTAEKFLEE